MTSERKIEAKLRKNLKPEVFMISPRVNQKSFELIEQEDYMVRSSFKGNHYGGCVEGDFVVERNLVEGKQS